MCKSTRCLNRKARLNVFANGQLQNVAQDNVILVCGEKEIVDCNGVATLTSDAYGEHSELITYLNGDVDGIGSTAPRAVSLVDQNSRHFVA